MRYLDQFKGSLTSFDGVGDSTIYDEHQKECASVEEVAIVKGKRAHVVGLSAILAARPLFFNELKGPRDVVDVLGVHLESKIEGREEGKDGLQTGLRDDRGATRA